MGCLAIQKGKPAMKLRLLSLALALGLLGLFAIAPLSASAAPPSTSAVSVPVTGDFLGGTFSGIYNITSFVTQNGQLFAVGTLTGTLTDTLTGATTTITNVPVRIPVDLAGSSGSCQVLHLELGPLDLDLLGLVIHLDRVVLDITAQSGPGNLLGNLLCGIAGLLDSGGPLRALTTALNQLLQLL